MSSRPPLVLNAGHIQQLQSGDWADIGVPYMMHKNRIINGDFRVWQRGTGISIASSGTYTADRWLYLFDGTGVSISCLREAFTPGQTDVPDNPQYFLRSDTGGLSGSGQTFFLLGQKIEGVNNFAGQTVTISFWAKAAAAATIQTHLEQNFGTGGSPSSTVSTSAVNHSIGTTWTKVTSTVTLGSISGKTVGTNGGDNLGFYIGLPLNTTFTIDVAHVQVEYGSNATTFEFRHIQHELALCQRYFIRTGNNTQAVFFSTFAAQVGIFLPVPMRSTPTGTLSTSSPQITIPGVNTYTGSSSVVATLIGGAASGNGSNSLKGTVNGFTVPSSSLSVPAFVVDDYFLLSAEL